MRRTDDPPTLKKMISALLSKRSSAFRSRDEESALHYSMKGRWAQATDSIGKVVRAEDHPDGAFDLDGISFAVLVAFASLVDSVPV